MVMSFSRRLLPRRLLLGAWGALLLWLSLTPRPPVIRHPFLGWDKLQHGAAFCVFTLLAGWAFSDCRADDRRCWRRAVVAAGCFGLLIEVLQGLFTATRSAEAVDLLADLLGALAAYAMVRARKNTARRVGTPHG